MTTDSELLRQFARTNTEDAFAELVRRHVNLVYSVALRRVNGDGHLARDVAQTVFTDLARKAGSLAQRRNISGWLYTSAQFAAAKMVRTENRRRDREAQFMREPIHESAPDPEWTKIKPELDDAMHELKESDREAILLRYFENRPFADVGAKLGLNENAARMRVERALEKLRASFGKRGITTAATLTAVLSANAVQIAPANLAATLATTSILAAGTGTFTLLKIMTATNLKLGLSTLVIAGTATALVVQHQAQQKLRDENGQLQRQIAQLQTDNERYSNRLATAADSPKLTDGQYQELLKLRGEVGVLRNQAGELAKTREQLNEAGRQLGNAERRLEAAVSAANQFKSHQTSVVNAAKQIGLAIRIFANDHDHEYPTHFEQLTNELGNSYSIGGIDLGTFEFVNVGATFDHPNMVEIRERLARQDPEGTWDRIYGFADGSVQTATSYDGNFDAWEKANTYVPPPGQ